MPTIQNMPPNLVWDEEELLNHFLALVTIPSPSRNERKVADYLIAFCQQHNIAYHEDDAGSVCNGNSGNIIARIPGNPNHTILLSAHMDTVLPCDAIHPMIKDGIIYSDDTSILGSDDKSGIAAMLVLMRQAAQSTQTYPNLVFVFSIAEEIGLLGVRGLAQEQLEGIDAAFVLDASGKPGECVIAAPYLASGTISIVGKEAHAGNCPELGINALTVAAHAISKCKMGRIDEETTSNIGIVSGGLAPNIVMGNVSMAFEARSLDKAKLQQVLASTKETFQEVCTSSQAQLNFDVDITTPGYRINQDNPFVKRVQAAAQHVGLSFRTKQSGGASDANIYHAARIPALTLATGMSHVHTCHECIAIEDLMATAVWIDAIVKAFVANQEIEVIS